MSWQRYNILLEKAKKFIFFSNHFDSDISVRIEVKANHRTSRSERYGCPVSRQPHSFPSDHRWRGFHRDGYSPAWLPPHRCGHQEHSSLPRQCKECDMEFACHGECPKNRFMKDKYGDSGLNYLCPGYYHYYQHVAPYMDYMKQELMSQRPPSNIMKVVQ